MIPVGKFPQFAVIPGLVQVNVLPPAPPDTAIVPLQGVPVVVTALIVKVPEKVVVVVAPLTVPLNRLDVYVPFTADPACVKFIPKTSTRAPPVACVY